MNRKLFFVTICLGLLTIIASGLSGCAGASPSPLTKISVSYSAPTASQAVAWIAQDAGLFTKYGLEASISNITAANQIVAVAGGHVNVALGPSSTAVSSMLEGADVVEVALLNSIMAGQLTAQKNIKTAADLKGKLVGGMGKYPNPIDLIIDTCLKAIGLDPEKDVQRRYMADEARYMAFFSGEIDATLTQPSNNFKAQKLGYNFLYDVRKDRIPNPGLSIYVNRSWLKNNRVTAVNSMKAFLEAIMVMQTKPDYTADVVMKWTQEEDRVIAKMSGEFYANGYDRIPKWTEANMKLVLSQLTKDKPKAAEAVPANFYDNSILEELEKSGFIDKLWVK